MCKIQPLISCSLFLSEILPVNNNAVRAARMYALHTMCHPVVSSQCCVLSGSKGLCEASAERSSRQSFSASIGACLGGTLIPMNPASTYQPPRSIRETVRALWTYWGRCHRMSRPTASGTCTDIPTVAMVGPASRKSSALTAFKRHVLNHGRACHYSTIRQSGSLCWLVAEL